MGATIAASGLIPFLKAHPDWKINETADTRR
jgi:hypothetical protein